ncbi:phage tail assembly chaperone [Aquisalinus flavus]|nr:phage tail assembly chaperone [Aquisalinus flavus]MBD0426290.1 phage tail assembly chaperone [Aquisalinus flavus]UNE48142.1 phage tail assembly chaperone [Aquisalinus flavus]
MRLAPDQFWAMSLAEWQLLSGGGAGGGALTRESFDQLRTLYPDEDQS